MPVSVGQVHIRKALGAPVLYCCTVMAAHADDLPGGCERFQQGDLVIEQIEDFDLSDPGRTSVSFIELRYDPAYLLDSAIPPRPDGLPDRAQLFRLDALTGEPLTALEGESGRDFTREGTVDVLVRGARSVIELDEAIRSMAGAPPGAPYRRTGQQLGGLEGLDVPEGVTTAPGDPLGEDVFARFASTGQVEVVMSCSRPGTVPNPQCSAQFKTDELDIKVGSIRRDELDHLNEILSTVWRFATCLHT